MARVTATSVRRLVAPMTVALVSLTLLIAPAVADTNKPYAVVMTPGNVPAGSTSSFTATLINETVHAAARIGQPHPPRRLHTALGRGAVPIRYGRDRGEHDPAP